MVIQFRSFNEYKQEPGYSNVSNRVILVKFPPRGDKEVDVSRICTASELMTKGKCLKYQVHYVFTVEV